MTVHRACAIWDAGAGLRSVSLILRLFDRIARRCSLGAAAHLAFENRRRIRGYQLDFLKNEFGIETVARRLVNSLAAEFAVQFVFVIVVASEVQLLAIRSEFVFFIQHHHLCSGPWLTRFAHVTPEFEIWFVVTAADEVIARGLGRNPLCHVDAGLLNSGRRRGDAASEEESCTNAGCEK